MKQRLEASVKSEDELKEQVTAQQKQVEDANQHCEALQKAREDAEDELQVGHASMSCLLCPTTLPQDLSCVSSLCMQTAKCEQCSAVLIFYGKAA